MCHQINSTKEEGRNSHEESTEIIFMCLSSPLQETLFSSCVLFFPIISNLHPSVVDEVVRRSNRGCATHSYRSGSYGRGLLLQQQ